MRLLCSTTLSVLLAICLGSTSCRQDTSSTTSAATQTVPQLEVATVKSQKLSTTERLPAELVPYESVDLYAKETGFVRSIRAKWHDPSQRRPFQAVSQRPTIGLIRIPASPTNCRYSTHSRELPRSKMFKISR